MKSDSKLGDPMLWSYAYEHIQTAAPVHRLHGDIVDFFLLKSWYGTVQDESGSNAYYLDMMTVKKIDQSNLENSICQILLLPEGTGIPMKPVLFSPDFVQGSELLNMILFDYNKNVVLVFGHDTPFETDMHASWDEWEGPNLWKAIADLFGWEIGQKIKVIQPNWAKVKCFILLKLMPSLYSRMSTTQNPGLPYYA